MLSLLKSPRYTAEELEARLKFFAGFVLILVFGASMLTVVYSLVFVTQPMGGIAPADKQFFKLLETMTTFLAGSISTLVTTKIASSMIQKAYEPTPAPSNIDVDVNIDNKDENNVSNKSDSN